MKFILSLLLTVLLCVPVSSVAQATTTITPDEKKAKQRESAVAFLRETSGDIGNLRSLENRISFTSELAALLWYHDQKEASTMFGTAVGDFKQLLAVYDGQMNSLGPKNGEDDLYSGIPFMGEPTDRSRVERKFRTALGVRQQVAMSIAEHEPELAYNFFYDSVSLLTNPEFRKQIETSDQRYEQQLLTRIASTDIKKAVTLGKRSLGKGVTSGHVDLLKKLHAKEPEAASEFGDELLGRLKSTSSADQETHIVRSLLSLGDSSAKPGKDAKPAKPIYSNGKLSELAEILARGIMESKIDEDSSLPDISLVEKYAPGRAIQIKARFASSGARRDSATFTAIGAPPPPMPRSSAEGGPISITGIGSGTKSGGLDPAMKARLEREEQERNALEDAKKLGETELPKEEREKIIGKAREILGRTKSKMQRIAGLSALAASIAKSGDKKLAADIMQEARLLINPQPKNYIDLMNMWAFATGYAVVDPDKAFPLFDEMIFKTNDLVSAIVKLAEFADVNEEIITDGEFQVGAFGGQMIQSFTRSAGIADSSIKVLIDADFEKTKALTNRVDRSELRILTKVMIIRSILGKETNPEQMIEEMLGPDFSADGEGF